jgi:hypothetical protein
VALAEIELCGELMIAASSAEGERLSSDRIDEVLEVASARAESAVSSGSSRSSGSAGAAPRPRR